MKVHNKILKAFGALLIAALLFGAMPAGEVKAQTGQDLYVAEWSDVATISGFTGRPMVVHDGTTYHMWYGPSNNELYHTSSTDPSSFPVGTLTSFDSVPYEVSSPAIVYEGGVFYLITYKPGTNLVFSVYTSSDGVSWNYKGDVYDGTGLGTQGTDWRKIDAPTLLPDNGTYKLYFQVAPVSGDYKIFMAETGATTLADIADGDNDNDFTLANSNSPVLTVGGANTPDETHVQHPMVVKDGDTYFMWYTGVAPSGSTYYWRSLNLATSLDGVSWTKSPGNPVWFDTYSSAEPTVVKVGESWHLWFEANEGRIDYLSASGPFEFQTIQSAIDAASDGDTVNVAPGTYVEGAAGDAIALNLDVPNLTLKSTGGREVTTIDAGGATTAAYVYANLGDVTFDGFKVINFAANGVVQSHTKRDGTAFHILNNLVLSSDGYLRNGLQVSGDGSTVIGNIVYGAPLTEEWASTGIGVIDATDALVKENVIDQNEGEGTFPDIGINVMSYNYETSNITVENNTVTNAGDGVRISAVDRTSPAPLPVKNVTITGNTLSDNTIGINVYKADVDGLTIEYNDILSNHDDPDDGDGYLYGSGIRFMDVLSTVTNAAINENTFSDNETYQIFGHSGALIDVDLVITANTFDKAVVIEGEPVIYSTIQGAIDAASDGDKILVSPGTYDEALELNVPNITVQSTDGRDATILDVPDGTRTTGVKLLADMGTVTFDGFTVKDFTEGGIIQGMSASSSVFHVLNNKVIPAADYLRNGIQVSGDGSTVIGNFVEGAYLTEDWAATAIGVVNASNVLVQYNEVSGAVNGIDTGIAVYTWGEFTITGNQVLDNIIYNVDYPLVVESYNNGTTTDVDIHENKVTNYEVALLAEPYPDDPYKGLEVSDVDASLNWWGSACGPIGGIEGEAIYSPWYIDDTMTATASGEIGAYVFPTDSLRDTMNAIIACAAPESTFTFEGGTYPGGLIVDLDDLTFNLNGATVGKGSPAFTINGDNTIINGPGTLDGGGSSDSAVFVNDGVSNVTINKLEILNWANGVYYDGEIINTQIVDNFIHDNTGDGVYFTQQPTIQTDKSFYIQGNLFKNNGGVAINHASTGATEINAEYNSWGDVNGTTLTNVDTNPYTHVDLYMESKAPNVDTWADQVFINDTITYEVKANVVNLTTAAFEFTYPTDLLGSPTIANINSAFYPVPTKTDIVDATTAGVITFDGQTGEYSLTPIDGDIVLFEVTFTALQAGTATLDFIETTDEFGMSPNEGPSNNIYADELADSTLNIISRPVITEDDLDRDYVAGILETFTVTVDNPSDGGVFDQVLIKFTLNDTLLSDIYSFECKDSTDTWVDMPLTQVDANVEGYWGPSPGFEMISPYSATTECRVVFNNTGEFAVDITVEDTLADWELAGLEKTVTVLGNFDVTGTISMQGRTVRSDVPLTLTDVDGAPLYGPFEVFSTSELAYNVLFSGVNGGIYEITTLQPRYLNVTADLDKQISITGGYTMTALELKGGNAVWTDNVINIQDASAVGSEYGSTLDVDADVNFDGKVSIQDLALVGGNFDLTSSDVYGSWLP